MKHLTVVFDTNILVSGLLYGGTPELAIQTAIKREMSIIASAPLLEEQSRIFSQKFSLPKKEIEALTKELSKRSIIVTPGSSLKVVSDEPDNRVLEAAVTGHCSFIVTGDKGLLELKTYKSIQILTPRQFLDQIQHNK